MDRICARLMGDLQDTVDPQVAIRRGCAAQRVGVIRIPDMQRAPVHIRKDRYCPDAQFVTGPDNPDGDLSSIGDQHSVQHLFSPFIRYAARTRLQMGPDRRDGAGAPSSGGISPELFPIPSFRPTSPAWLARTGSDASDNHLIQHKRREKIRVCLPSSL